MVLPEDFTRQMQAQLDAIQYDAFLHALTDEEAPVSIRLNPNKRIAPPAGSERVPWCPDGYYLRERPSFTLDPLFHAGCYYVQEASSMYLAEVIQQILPYIEGRRLNILDLCAAPGGKSTLLLSQLPEDTLVVCNEIVRSRAQILRENIIKWGAPNAVVTNNQASDFQPAGLLFDLILCDAPCSGEGMFRKDPQTIGEWSLRNVEMCQQRQRSIVADIWPCLRQDGFLIYSTCTYNNKENEENVRWICDRLGAEHLCSRRFMPHLTRGEGLFMAVLRKTSPLQNLPRKEKNNKRGGLNRFAQPNRAHEALLKTWLRNSKPYQFIASHPDTLHACLKVHEEPVSLLLRHLHVLEFGVQLATIKGKEKLQPSHSLSMSNLLNPNAFIQSDIDLQTALSYLRAEAITLSTETPRGYVLLTWKNHPLGFVNNLGSRANNLYPSEWRIRKQ